MAFEVERKLLKTERSPAQGRGPRPPAKPLRGAHASRFPGHRGCHGGHGGSWAQQRLRLRLWGARLEFLGAGGHSLQAGQSPAATEAVEMLTRPHQPPSVYFLIATSKRTSRPQLGTCHRPARPAWLPGPWPGPWLAGAQRPLRHASRGGREGLEPHEAGTAVAHGREPPLLSGVREVGAPGRARILTL